MRRGKYDDYRYLILKHLATLSPEARLQDLRKQYQIPKGSLSEVVHLIEREGLVKVNYMFPKRKKLTITQKGLEEWEKTVARQHEYKLPWAAEKYLNVKGLKQENLFPVQHKFVQRGLLHRKDNAAVFAYPGTGKTLIAEMVIATVLQDGGKVLFCTPYRALDWQKYQDFQGTFGGEKLRKKVVLSDGDNPVASGELDQADVVVATYERVQGAIARGEPWLESVGLACVDELTHLGEDERGGTLDLVLTKLKEKPGRRIVGLSSLVGNSMGLSDWLKAEPVIEVTPMAEIKEYVAYRSQDSLVFLGKDGVRKDIKTTLDPISHVVKENLRKDLTTLVFVGKRMEAKRLAAKLASLHKSRQELEREARLFLEDGVIENTMLTKELCGLIGRGVAFHHAGLQRTARRFVERLLRERKLRTIVATTTLSHGVDYQIDNVIIDLPGMLATKNYEFQGYEYLNLKGRTGRPGLSLEANVYVLAEPRQVKRVQNKYFYASPEEVIPPNTFDSENLALTVLTEVSRGAKTERDVLRILRETYRATRKRLGRAAATNVVNQMAKFGFVQKKDSQLILTELGKKVVHSNLSPYDAVQVLRLWADSSDDAILELASSIDLARRKRAEPRLRTMKNIPGLVKAFIQEDPIDEIRILFGLGLDDQDIIELAEYTARSLQKMVDLVQDLGLKRRVEALYKRVRLGWKADLLDSELGRLPVLVSNKNRVLARKLLEVGLGKLEAICAMAPSELATSVGVSLQTAQTLVQQASPESEHMTRQAERG